MHQNAWVPNEMERHLVFPIGHRLGAHGLAKVMAGNRGLMRWPKTLDLLHCSDFKARTARVKLTWCEEGQFCPYLSVLWFERYFLKQ